MKLVFIRKNEKQFSMAFFAVSALLAAGIFIGLCDFIVTSVRASQLAAATVKQAGADANDTDKSEGQPEKLVEKLKKKNVFVPPSPDTKFPVDSVSGIFGKEVLIQDKWYKVGDKIGDGEIVSIEPTQVTIKWNGDKKTFAPIAAIGSAGISNGQQEGKGEEQAKKEQTADGKTAEQKQQGEQAAGQSDKEDPLAWMGMDLTQSQREKLELIFSRMPAQFTEQLKQQWNNMSDEEKQQGLEEIDRMSMEQIELQIDQMNQMNTDNF